MLYACGTCPFSLYSCEPYGFSAFWYVATVTHMTPRGVLQKLCKVTSGTKRRDSCSFSLLLSNAPKSAQRYTTKSGTREEIESAHETQPFWRLLNTLLLFTPPAAATFGAMLRGYHMYVVLLWVALQEHRSCSCLNRFCRTTQWNSKLSEHFIFFSCGIKDESSSAWRYKVQNLFPK